MTIPRCKTCGQPMPEAQCGRCDNPAEWPAAEHAMFQPPWREMLPGAGLSPSYGPQTHGAHARVVKVFMDESRGAVGSPALWDRTQEATTTGHVPARDVPRQDGDLFESRIPVMAQAMPARELQAAMLFWRDRLSVGRIARSMAVAANTVRSWLERTRKRMKGQS